MTTYRLADFVLEDQITISTAAQRAPHHPFTLPCARDFFRHFGRAQFEVESEVRVRSIYISSGKNALPRHSFAHGYLLGVPLEVYEARGLAGIPDPIGAIHCEYGGATSEPRVWATNPDGREATTSSETTPDAAPRQSASKTAGSSTGRSIIAVILALMLIAAGATVVQLGRRGEPTRTRGTPAAPLRSSVALVVTVERANIRAAPSPTARVVAQEQRGARLVAGETRGEWYRVVVDEATGVTGWVHNSVVAALDAAVPR